MSHEDKQASSKTEADEKEWIQDVQKLGAAFQQEAQFRFISAKAEEEWWKKVFSQIEKQKEGFGRKGV